MLNEEVLKAHSPGSHVPIWVQCDLKVSPRCRNRFQKEIRTIHRDRSINAGKDVCFYCSRTSKYSGRSNPNCRYPDVDDFFFSNITSEEQAYALGLIASDGHISKSGSIELVLHKNDISIVEQIRDLLSPSYELKKLDVVNQVGLYVSSSQMTKDICSLLEIVPGKKSHNVGFPTLDGGLYYHFVRGFFDGDGSISHLESNSLQCKITTNSLPFRRGLSRFLRKELNLDRDYIEWYGEDALDFLGKLYDNASIFLNRKRDLYLDWCVYVPALTGTGSYGKSELFRWQRTRPDAIPPEKTRASDSGFDLTLLEKVKTLGKVELYDTGIKVKPAQGWYFDLVGRSSIIKSGYMVANSFGVIDRSYRGPVMAALVKIDPHAPDLELPNRLVQMIPRPIIHGQYVEVEVLDETDRGEGGFGSTGV